MKYVWVLNCEEGWRTMVFDNQKDVLEYIKEMYPGFKKSYEDGFLSYYENKSEENLRVSKKQVISSETIPDYVWVLMEYENENEYVFATKKKAEGYIKEMFPQYEIKNNSNPNCFCCEKKNKEDGQLRLEKEMVNRG